MREKIIELLIGCSSKTFYRPVLEGAADYLITNGVTIQHWIPVAEKMPEDLPENSGKKKIPCLVAYYPGNGKKRIVQFRERRAGGPNGWYWPKVGACSITHWMPMPEAPEEV